MNTKENDIKLIEKKIHRVRTHVNPLKYIDLHQFEGFKNKKEIIVDIGCAKADFITKLNEKFQTKDNNSKYNYIGFEVRPLIIKYLKIKYANNKNFVFFSGDANKNLINTVEPSIKNNIEIKYIFINFPDPWIKNKHIKRRLVNKEFLNKLYELFNKYKLKTKIIIQTDVDYMYEDIIKQIQESKFKKHTLFDKPLFDIQTRWEIQSIKKQKPIYRIKIN